MNTKIKIGKKIISSNNNKVFIIAEAGVSHFGSLKKAKKLIDFAKNAGADAVKFQAYITEELIYKNYKDWFKRYKVKEVDYNFFLKLKLYAKKKNIIFLCTPHTETAITWVDKLNVPAIKVGSGELGNFEFLNKIIKLKKPIIISTGMHTEKDMLNLKKYFLKKKKKDVCFLNCITQYPTENSSINLINFKKFKKIFKNFLVGYSDHTNHDIAIIGSIVLGARIIEKHISLDFNIKNAQDWKVSFDYKRFHMMVKNIRIMEKILGKYNDFLTPFEKKSKIWATKSIFSSKNIKKGEKYKKENLTFKRPGVYIPVKYLGSVLGKKSKSFIKKDTPIKISEI